eukprot:3430434-Amphidinium_carterae.1
MTLKAACIDYQVRDLMPDLNFPRDNIRCDEQVIEQHKESKHLLPFSSAAYREAGPDHKLARFRPHPARTSLAMKGDAKPTLCPTKWQIHTCHT